MKKLRKILLVDDSITQALRIKAILENDGYLVFLSKNGSEALDFLKNNILPDLILTDIVMPIMDGFDLCLNVKKSYPNTPVIIFTEFNNQGKLQKAFECGAIEYIPKPFSELELLVRVKNVLELKKNEKTYKNLFNKMINGFALFEVIFDKKNNPVDYVFREVNNAFEKLTDLPRTAVVSNRLSKVLPGNDKALIDWIQILNDIVRSEQDQQFEGYSKSLDKWFYITTYIPEKGFIATIFRDITERKKSEQKLIENETRLINQYKILLEILKKKILYFKSLNESFKFITKAASEALNVERASIWLLTQNKNELICKDLYSFSSGKHSAGYKLKSFDYPDYFKNIYKENIIAVNDALSDPKVHEFTEHYLNPLGITSMLDVGIRIEGNVIGVLCFEHTENKRKWLADELLFASSIASITAHIIITSNLSNSEQRFKDICNSMADWVWEINEEGRYTYCSEKIKDVLGYSNEELIGKTPFYFMPPKEAKKMEDKLNEIIREKKEIRDIENIVLHKTGKPVCILRNGLPFFDKSGKFKGYRGVNKDITLRKKYEKELNKSKYEIENAHKHAMYMLAVASEYKDPETGDHIKRIVELTKKLALELKIEEQKAEKLSFDCILHDLGKLGISDHILLKPGKLTTKEYEIIKQHTTIGAKIIGNDNWFKESKEIALAHHEHWDGKGYPKGLKGSEIPLSARIVAVADVFDALISKRPYKDDWSLGDTIKEIQNESGKQFDPKVVDALMALHKKGELKKYNGSKD